jgi:hypothetical protein
MRAAAKDSPKLSLKALSVRGDKRISKNWVALSEAALSIKAERGIRTISAIHVSVKPNVIPNPGITL